MGLFFFFSFEKEVREHFLILTAAGERRPDQEGRETQNLCNFPNEADLQPHFFNNNNNSE